MADELAGWLAASPRFRSFAELHRDKIRKKLRGAADAEARRDVRAELSTARLLLGDRHIQLAFEAYGSGRVGPDFTVSFRGDRGFNLEVTRLRRIPDVASYGGQLLAKLRQLPPSVPNAVLLAIDADRVDAVDVGGGRSRPPSPSRSEGRSLLRRPGVRGNARFLRALPPIERGLRSERVGGAGGSGLPVAQSLRPNRTASPSGTGMPARPSVGRVVGARVTCSGPACPDDSAGPGGEGSASRLTARLGRLRRFRPCRLGTTVAECERRDAPGETGFWGRTPDASLSLGTVGTLRALRVAGSAVSGHRSSADSRRPSRLLGRTKPGETGMAGKVRALSRSTRPAVERGGRLLICALTVLVVAACGSSGGPTPTANLAGATEAGPAASEAAPASYVVPASQGGQVPVSNLCTVWTQDQVDAAGGGSLGAGVPQNDGQMCLWQNETNASISISINPEGSGATYQDTCSVSDPSIVKVDGVGDAACFLVAGTIGTQLVFKKGSNSFTVGIQRLDVTLDQIEAAEKTLAQAAAAKL